MRSNEWTDESGNMASSPTESGLGNSCETGGACGCDTPTPSTLEKPESTSSHQGDSAFVWLAPLSNSFYGLRGGRGKFAAPWSPSQALMACGFNCRRTLSILASAEALDAALLAIKKRVSPHSLYQRRLGYRVTCRCLF